MEERKEVPPWWRSTKGEEGDSPDKVIKYKRGKK